MVGGQTFTSPVDHDYHLMSRPHTPRPSSTRGSENTHQSRAKPDKRERKARKRAAENALEISHTMLGIAEGVAGNFGVPGLEAGLSALAKVVEKVQKTSANVDGVVELQRHISKLEKVLSKFRGKMIPVSMKQGLDGSFSEWINIGNELDTLKSRGRLMRFLRSEIDADDLSGLVRRLNTSLQDFQFEGVLDIEARMNEIQDQLSESFMSTYAKKAQYDANLLRRTCLKGTRVKILGGIGGWIDKNAAQLAEGSMEGGSIVWVNGLAGAGKTTIACSVAEECAQKKRLVASFFCDRSDAECSNPSLIFVTIARQICRVYPAYREKVIEVLKGDPDIVNAGVSRQLEKLIVEPLEALKGTLPASVVVIDALDECRDPNTTSIILSALAKFIGRLGPLLFIITSRPEQHITALFRKSHDLSLAAVTTPLILHEVEPESVSEDIKHVLDEGFTRIRASFEIDYDWPSRKDVQQLKTLSNGLFIFATTALGFIADKNFSDPEGQLQSLLARQSLPQPADSIMDSLYLQVLETAYPKPSDSLTAKLQTILGAIALAEESLSTTGFAALLGVSEPSVRQTLSGLRSVLHIPEDKSQPIGVIHATFPQFLLRESSSKPAAFHIQLTTGHVALLSRCFDVLNTGLHRDILEIKNPTLLKDEIPDLPEKVAHHIPSHLGYACRYWAAHLQACLGDGSLDGLFAQVQPFLHNMLLYWIEACIWLDTFATAVTSLDIARSCFMPSERFSTFVPLLIDCRRFALAYSSCIQDAPLQVYYSALSLAPRCSLVAKAYAKEVQHPLIIRQGAHMDWGPHLATIQQHTFSMVFAPNGGARFVTGGPDNTVYVWDSTTYTKILSIDGHTGSVMSVRYSPDGKYIVSGSADKTVRLWDAESGAHIRTLEGHRGSVFSLTYSAGNRVLAATDTGSVKLWDASDGQCMLTFDTGTYATQQVSISPNGSLITYCTTSSLCLLNVSTEEHVYLDLAKHGATFEEYGATFSPDGQYVAGWTNEVSEIYVWRVSDRTLRRIVDLHTSLGHVSEVYGRATYMAFSSDSTQIGCGCKDGSVRLWQVATDDPPVVLTGHQALIWDIAWSPDGSLICVWDLSHRSTATGIARPRSHCHSPDAVPRFAIIANGDAVTLCDLPHTAVAGKSCGDVIPLPEGAPLVTLRSTIGEAWSLAMVSKHDGDDDLQLRCGLAHTWEFWMGRRMFQRRGPSMPPVLSQDGLLLAYTPLNADQSIHICDLRSGTDILTFVHGHTSHTTAVSFSADGKRLATGSADHDVKIWYVASGRLVASHSGHTEQVESVALSSDGRLVVSGQHGDGGARVLDTHTGRVSEWREYLSDAVNFTFTPDDRTIVALTPDDLRLLVWDIATETCIHNYLFYGPTGVHSVNFSPDDTGIRLSVGGDTIQLWRPGERIWAVYTIDNKGWVYAKRPGHTQRLCWLPMEWRNPLSSDGDAFCVFDYNERKVIELDMSQLLLAAETWPQYSQPPSPTP